MNFTGIYHAARKELGLSCNEYCVADMVSVYAANPDNPFPGWCFASRQTLADDLGVSKVSIVALVEKCIQAGVLEKNPANGNLRITRKFYEAVHNSERIYRAGKESLPSVKKVNHKESLPSDKNLNQPGKESLPTVGKESLPYINELEINDLEEENPLAASAALTRGQIETGKDSVENFDTSGEGLKNLATSEHQGLDAEVEAGRQESPPEVAPAPPAEAFPFVEFWKLYPVKEGRKKCEAKWRSLPAKDRAKVMGHCPGYLKKLIDRGKAEFIKHPYTYLNAEDWRFAEEAQPLPAYAFGGPPRRIIKTEVIAYDYSTHR